MRKKAASKPEKKCLYWEDEHRINVSGDVTGHTGAVSLPNGKLIYAPWPIGIRRIKFSSAIASIAYEAFEAGKAEMRKELRDLLEVPSTQDVENTVIAEKCCRRTSCCDDD